jgi:excisionase family DNA binding protein
LENFAKQKAKNMEITFEQLPKAVTALQETINDIKQLLLEKKDQHQPEADELLTVQDTAKFLSLSVPTVYGLIHKGELPVMKRSKRCYFSKIELINYLKQGRKKTNVEAAGEADNYLFNQKKRGL